MCIFALGKLSKSRTFTYCHISSRQGIPTNDPVYKNDALCHITTSGTINIKEVARLGFFFFVASA